MPSEISVQAVAVAHAGSDGAIDPRVATASESPVQAEPAPAPSPIINPTLRLDAALGLVVIEFRNDSGAVTTSIPSERQIEAYQRWAQTHSGQAPTGQDESAAAAPAIAIGQPAAHASTTERRPAQPPADRAPSPPPERRPAQRTEKS
ncbi:MAG TPA: hypothetical protein VGI78_18930 [Acetobacteraceae bacterium]|jgi:hypothetical protein